MPEIIGGFVAYSPEDRFKIIMDELEKRFPHPAPFANEMGEVHYFKAIDDLRLKHAKLINLCDRLFHRVARQDLLEKGSDITEEIRAIIYENGKQTPIDARHLIRDEAGIKRG